MSGTGGSTLDLGGKAVVITGAASGLGLGLAKELSRRGANIVLADIEQSRLERAAAEIAPPAQVMTVRTDVACYEDVETLVAKTTSRFGAPHLICSNAGVAVPGPIWELTAGDWAWTFGVNLWGTVNVIRAFVPLLRGRNEGHLHITVSNSAVTMRASNGAYFASKHALLSVAETLALDLRAEGSSVGVSVSLPGAIRSRMAFAHRNRGEQYGPADVDETFLAERTRRLQEVGHDPDEMARGIVEHIDAGRFYIFTDPADADWARQRADQIIGGQLVAGTASPTMPRLR